MKEELSHLTISKAQKLVLTWNYLSPYKLLPYKIKMYDES